MIVDLLVRHPRSIGQRDARRERVKERPERAVAKARVVPAVPGLLVVDPRELRRSALDDAALDRLRFGDGSAAPSEPHTATRSKSRLERGDEAANTPLAFRLLAFDVAEVRQ